MNEREDDLREIEALAAKCEQETQVFLGHRNIERAASIRRVIAELRRVAKDAERLEALAVFVAGSRRILVTREVYEEGIVVSIADISDEPQATTADALRASLDQLLAAASTPERETSAPDHISHPASAILDRAATSRANGEG